MRGISHFCGNGVAGLVRAQYTPHTGIHFKKTKPSDAIQALASVPRVPAYNINDSLDRFHIASINQSLQNVGIALVDLKFRDDSSIYLQQLVLGFCKYYSHRPPITHSARHGILWDVKPNPEAKFQARSEGKLTFPWHTDCSYESSPPRFFGLHVLHADRFGGGTLSVLETSRLIHMLTPPAQQCLSRPEFRINVPAEFDKGISSIIGGLVARGNEHDPLRIRFRADIVEPLTEDGRMALDELNELLTPEKNAESGSLHMEFPAQLLPDNTVILMDNGRWLHSRTEVRDSRRHLRRLRWDRQEFGVGYETHETSEGEAKMSKVA